MSMSMTNIRAAMRPDWDRGKNQHYGNGENDVTEKRAYAVRQTLLTSQHELGVVLEWAKKPESRIRISDADKRTVQRTEKILDRIYKSLSK